MAGWLGLLGVMPQGLTETRHSPSRVNFRID